MAHLTADDYHHNDQPAPRAPGSQEGSSEAAVGKAKAGTASAA